MSDITICRDVLQHVTDMSNDMSRHIKMCHFQICRHMSRQTTYWCNDTSRHVMRCHRHINRHVATCCDMSRFCLTCHVSMDMLVPHDLLSVSKRVTFNSSFVIQLISNDSSGTNIQHIRVFISVKKLTPSSLYPQSHMSGSESDPHASAFARITSTPSSCG